ncbi:MAG: hypothetical protein MJ101_03690 [Clostridia bacterium]|nr:hypothetical protein [Clostridia bacterium]
MIVTDNEKYLIKNTTKEQRERIVSASLYAGNCLGCVGCDATGLGNPLEIYHDYIEGVRELAEINAEIRGGIIR